MTTVLQARPRQFVSTPAIEQLSRRAFRYLQTGYSVHLKGPAGTGKTTLAMHLADMLGRPTMMLFGDDDFKTSDLIGNQTGYTRKKVVDNYIHSVVKVEDELRQSWVDSRLTMACREGFTLVYDEFNRSRPEVNNVLLSALEEKLLVLPPNGHRQEYVRVNPHFRVIFTSNPEEYCGVHATQDALMDRLITIHLPAPDELTQQRILVEKVEIDAPAALTIVRVAQAFLKQLSSDSISSLRPCLMIATVCKEHEIVASVDNPDFRDLCRDILLSRASQSIDAANEILWAVFNQFDQTTLPTTTPAQSLATAAVAPAAKPAPVAAAPLKAEPPASEPPASESIVSQPTAIQAEPAPAIAKASLTVEPTAIQPEPTPEVTTEPLASESTTIQPEAAAVPEPEPQRPANTPEAAIQAYLQTVPQARLSEIEQQTGLNRVAVVNALRALIRQRHVEKQETPGKPATYKAK
ncbi:MAG: gas vesicle protein GvpN [Cyanobacteria bacterium J06628_6]